VAFQLVANLAWLLASNLTISLASVLA